jgi:hypothetical protein
MNKFTKFYDTPSMRTKMVDVFPHVSISPGAAGSRPGDEFKWGELSLRITDDTSTDPQSPRYVLRLDRETATKIVEAFTAYLAERK